MPIPATISFPGLAVCPLKKSEWLKTFKEIKKKNWLRLNQAIYAVKWKAQKLCKSIGNLHSSWRTIGVLAFHANTIPEWTEHTTWLWVDFIFLHKLISASKDSEFFIVRVHVMKQLYFLSGFLPPISESRILFRPTSTSSRLETASPSLSGWGASRDGKLLETAMRTQKASNQRFQAFTVAGTVMHFKCKSCLILWG